MGELQKLHNIGEELEKMLNGIGIQDEKTLKQYGSKKVIMMLKEKYLDAVCVMKCYAIEGAIEGIRWHNLTGEKRKELKEFFKRSIERSVVVDKIWYSRK